MNDCVIIGGGVIGLSTAYELARRGRRVRVLDRNLPGEESSWAGAGILAPGARVSDAPPLARLAGLSQQLHPQWAQQLRDETGLDNGYRPCGGWYLARTTADEEALRAAYEQWRRWGLEPRWLDAAQLREQEPTLAPAHAAVLLSEEGQVRNPRHLKALLAACRARGVQITSGVSADDFIVEGSRVTGVRTIEGVISAEQFCITAGAWSRAVGERLGLSLGVRPIRGQMVLLNSDAPHPMRVVNDGHRYLVPRDDGRLLVGSTEEHVGFEKRTTAGAVAGLIDFAVGLVPVLAEARVERCWAGLRPGSLDGLPYLGQVPQLDNAFVAAGHHRQGLQLSCATAVVMAQLMSGEPTVIDLTPFRLDRPRIEPVHLH